MGHPKRENPRHFGEQRGHLSLQTFVEVSETFYQRVMEVNLNLVQLDVPSNDLTNAKKLEAVIINVGSIDAICLSKKIWRITASVKRG